MQRTGATRSFVLVHSPLVGPFSWELVAQELQRLDIVVILPSLTSPPHLAIPYWRHHVLAVYDAMKDARPVGGVILVGHSGAGPLLPAIGDALRQHVAGHILVDSALPRDGASRFDSFPLALREQWSASAVDGAMPAWTETELSGQIPDEEIRRRFAAELRPTPLAVYEEPIPVPSGWSNAPYGYLHFTSVYDDAAAEAQRRGWSYRRLSGSHFHMLNEPSVVAAALTVMAEAM